MTKHEDTTTAAGGSPLDRPVGRPVPERAVAVVTECEACFTPDVCQLRGTCDHYRAELLRVAASNRPAGCHECAWGKVLGCWRCGSR